MDIQYNNGPQAVHYLAKHLAKYDYEANIMTHYKTRIVGAVEAVHDFMEWHKHKNSRNVLFLNIGLINFDSRRVRDDIDALPENSENIFSKTPVEVYEARTDARNITMPQFFCFYSEMSGDSFYCQQIFAKLAIFATTFFEDKGRFMTWKNYYEHLINIPVDQGGIKPRGKSSVSSVDDLYGPDRGNDVTRQELEIEHNSANYISGAAGTENRSS
ncbi:hypothetical protein [Parasitella parasitica]|uniref:Uncharacterized protein n=1 Tax=Parasitella parasitica TaxID=35722 RepID=A0A0B7N2G7_9FUNG|nr:hypothetical protein [Parasitella parasitica]